MLNILQCYAMALDKIYIILFVYFLVEFYMDHPSKDVRCLLACCIADIFRIFAPDAPYTDPEQLKVSFVCMVKFNKCCLQKKSLKRN